MVDKGQPSSAASRPVNPDTVHRLFFGVDLSSGKSAVDSPEFRWIGTV